MKTQLQSSLAIWALSVSLAGCHYATHVAHTSASPLASAPASIPSAEIVPTSFFQPVSASSSALEQNVLELESLIQEVLHRNPSLAQMEAAWQAASTRFPQVTALEDPMIAGWMAPGSIGSNMVDFAGRLEVSQKIPYPGKRNLRGQAALAEAQATGRDVDDIRLQLIETTRMAFYDYYAVDRSLAVNEEALRLLGEFRDNAETRFKTAQGQQQDLLQADVEIGRQRERRLQLERTREVTLARINTLLHRVPDATVPPPPTELPMPTPLPEAAELRAMAVASRPELQALQDRLAADQAAVALAQKEFCPDFEAMAAYDGFWQGQDRPLQGQIGLKINLPVQKARRYAALQEAQLKLAARKAEWERTVDQVNYQVQQAYAQVRESEKALELYQQTLLPAVQLNIKAAQTAYVTAKVPFLSLLEAERDLVGLRERFYELTADYYRRRATLDRVVGVLPEPRASGSGTCSPLSPRRRGSGAGE